MSSKPIYRLTRQFLKDKDENGDHALRLASVVTVEIPDVLQDMDQVVLRFKRLRPDGAIPNEERLVVIGP